MRWNAAWHAAAVSGGGPITEGKMKYSCFLIHAGFVFTLLVAAFSSCYAKPGEDSAEESQDDLQGEEGSEGNLPVVECSTTSFPRTGDPCSAADHEAGIRCRQCGCGLSCCDSCDCEEDLRWSCGILCEDTYLDGGSERCYLGTPPRCLQTCVPLPESSDAGEEEEDGPTADIPDVSHDLPMEERMDLEEEDVAGGCEQVLPVKWDDIARGASTATNYQILPGDRLFIAEDKLIAFDSLVSKVTRPFERILGFNILGTQMVNRYKTLGSNTAIGLF